MTASETESSSPTVASVEEPLQRVASVKRAYRSGTTRSLAWRRAQLEGLLAFIEEKEELLTEAGAQDLGKPLFECWLGELVVVLSLIHI